MNWIFFVPISFDIVLQRSNADCSTLTLHFGKFLLYTLSFVENNETIEPMPEKNLNAIYLSLSNGYAALRSRISLNMYDLLAKMVEFCKKMTIFAAKGHELAVRQQHT